MRSFPAVCLCLSVFVLAGCVPRGAPPPEPTPPPPAPAPTPPPPPAPAPPPADWTLAPLTPGDWSYADTAAGSSAAYGSTGSPTLVIRCEAGRIALIHPGGNGGTLVFRTSFGERRLPAVAPGATAMVAASDPLLDQIAFSRGRFLVQTDGAPALIVPAWPETARVVEDCRA